MDFCKELGYCKHKSEMGRCTLTACINVPRVYFSDSTHNFGYIREITMEDYDNATSLEEKRMIALAFKSCNDKTAELNIIYLQQLQALESLKIENECLREALKKYEPQLGSTTELYMEEQ